MERINSIAMERTDLSTHVDLCSQRWEAAYNQIKTLKTICIILLIEATVTIIDAALDGKVITLLREMLKLII